MPPHEMEMPDLDREGDPTRTGDPDREREIRRIWNPESDLHEPREYDYV